TFQTKVRAPRQQYQFWALGVAIVGPLIAGLVGAIVGHTLTGSYTVATIGFLLLAMVSAGVLAKTLFATEEVKLALQMSETAARLEEASRLYAEAKLELAEAERLLTEARRRREEHAASITETQHRLLQQNWKAMRDPEWERF